MKEHIYLYYKLIFPFPHLAEKLHDKSNKFNLYNPLLYSGKLYDLPPDKGVGAYRMRKHKL